MFPLGADPGFISDARASGNPASISFRAGVYGIPKKKEHGGNACNITYRDGTPIPQVTSITYCLEYL